MGPSALSSEFKNCQFFALDDLFVTFGFTFKQMPLITTFLDLIRFMPQLVPKCVSLLFSQFFYFAFYIMEVTQDEYFQHISFGNRFTHTSHLTYQLSL